MDISWYNPSPLRFNFFLKGFIVMHLQNFFDGLEFHNKWHTVEHVLRQSKCVFNRDREFVVVAPGFEGVASFVRLTQQIAIAAEERFLSMNLTIHERACGISITREMKRLYLEAAGEFEESELLAETYNDVLNKFLWMDIDQYLPEFGDEMEDNGQGILLKHIDEFEVGATSNSEPSITVRVKEASIIARDYILKTRGCRRDVDLVS